MPPTISNMTLGEINPTELVATLINQADIVRGRHRECAEPDRRLLLAS